VGGFGNLGNVLRAFSQGSIFGETYGEGPVRVLWLHGWQRSHLDFAAAGALAAREGIASLAVDLPGFGASPLSPRAGGAALYAELLVPVLEDLAAPVLLVGHSFGGRVATVVSDQYPAMVKGLVLTGVPLVRLATSRRAPTGYRLVRRLRHLGLVSERRLESARQRYGSADYRQASGLLRDILVTSVNESYEENLSRLRVPVSLLWGSEDRDVPVEVARRARDLLGNSPDVRLEEVAGAGHLLPTQRPDALVAAVRVMWESW
jgi:pimeloyl-ACP methyl ester carboxylesterase